MHAVRSAYPYTVHVSIQYSNQTWNWLCESRASNRFQFLKQQLKNNKFSHSLNSYRFVDGVTTHASSEFVFVRMRLEIDLSIWQNVYDGRRRRRRRSKWLVPFYCPSFIHPTTEFQRIEAMATAQSTFGHSRSSICYVWSSGQCDSFNDNNGSSSNNNNANNIIIIRRLVESFLVFCFSSAVAADSVSSARFSILRRREFHALHHEIVFGELCIGCRPLSDAESKWNGKCAFVSVALASHRRRWRRHRHRPRPTLDCILHFILYHSFINNGYSRAHWCAWVGTGDHVERLFATPRTMPVHSVYPIYTRARRSLLQSNTNSISCV